MNKLLQFMREHPNYTDEQAREFIATLSEEDVKEILHVIDTAAKTFGAFMETLQEVIIPIIDTWTDWWKEELLPITGGGEDDKELHAKCPNCYGTGKRFPMLYLTCPKCDNESCRTCLGTGVV